MIGPKDLLHPFPTSNFKTSLVFLIYFPSISQFQHHTKLHSKCDNCSIPISAPHKATLQMLHLNYPNFNTTQTTLQMLHLCIPISAPHKVTLQMLHLLYPNFSTTQSYTPNVTLAVSQFQHHTKLHSICYTCSITISPPLKATLQMLHLPYPNFRTTQSYTPNLHLQ